MVGLLDDVERRVGMAPHPGDELMLIGPRTATLGASEYLAEMHRTVAGAPPAIDLDVERTVQRAVIELVSRGLISAAHDTSEGGLIVTLAEMVIAGETGAELDFEALAVANGGRLDRTLFGEAASRIVIALEPGRMDEVLALLDEREVERTRMGRCGGDVLRVVGLPGVSVDAMRETWRTGLAQG
jgi:phosphoribosylformylglycinamidine synthase